MHACPELISMGLIKNLVPDESGKAAALKTRFQTAGQISKCVSATVQRIQNSEREAGLYDLEAR